MTDTLEDARRWLRTESGKGARCPCCTQFVKVYRRKLNSGMARWLIRFHIATLHTPGFHHHSIVERGAGDWSVLEHWGLIEAQPHVAGEKKSSGCWRLTQKGRAFVRRHATVQSHARLYNDRLLALDGEPVDIVEALGRRFNYFELMRECPTR